MQGFYKGIKNREKIKTMKNNNNIQKRKAVNILKAGIDGRMNRKNTRKKLMNQEKSAKILQGLAKGEKIRTKKRLIDSLKESKKEATDQLLKLGNQDTIDEVATLAAASVMPEEFICPITLERMVDPVIASDGHSYERAGIRRSLQRPGEPTSPLTGLPLASTQLIPNIALRQLIENWLENHPGD